MYYKSNPSNYTRCEKCKHIDRENEKCKITNDKWLVSDDAGTCHQFEGVESMIVENVKPVLGLALGGIYTVIDEGDNYYLIENDCGKKVSYLKGVFEIVEDGNPHHKYELREFEENMKKAAKIARDMTNPIKPNHYKAGKFDVIAFCFEHDLDFATGNIIKYVTRAGKKDKSKTLEDLLKAKEYLERKIERVKAND